MRRIVVSCPVIALLLITSGFAQKKKANGMPQQVVVAQFMYVTSFHGDRFDPRTFPEDRQAIANMEEAIQAWHKYRLVSRPEDADIMLVVRPARAASARVGVGIPPIDSRGGGIDTGRPSTGGLGVGTDITSVPDDTLMVSLQPDRDPSAASFIWRRSQRNGLQGQKPALFEQFKKAVLEAEQQNPKKP
jgi:hypothetical protein